MFRTLLLTGITGAFLLAASPAARADAVGGPKYQTDRVEAHGTDVYKVRFYGGETAMVVVSGDGVTDLDLYVYDEFGNLVASDAGPTDDCLVTFVPRRTAVYTIKVVNRGYVYNRYRIGTK